MSTWSSGHVTYTWVVQDTFGIDEVFGMDKVNKRPTNFNSNFEPLTIFPSVLRHRNTRVAVFHANKRAWIAFWPLLSACLCVYKNVRAVFSHKFRVHV